MTVTERPAHATEAVQLRQVSRVYGTGDRAVTALDAVTLGFRSGTGTAVMGPSGSGKSTLLHCAAGLDRPTGGKVVVAGTDLGPLTETARTRLRRAAIGFVFQSFNLMPALTAEQNVALPLLLAGAKPPRDAVRAALAEVGLADRARHRPSELSGGQQQRVAIARALITRPAVVFADEPTGALDTGSSREVLGLLRRLIDQHGLTVVMVTHDPVAAAYADRVVFLADGRVADELTAAGGPPAAAEIATRMARLESAC
ncbi:ABC transporter ATP-binding protein [Pseudosporangium ferrugineum]|uniref:Putative ABC transport system ATP-binding protein n=1 Tax=Pseudosporangium ferrugineum TaxID=439699 RepID=A0A2T0RHF8_9ACTN|nr:ABC transporter ATP-binding protein [Pseudosporangium ferrugineum]PRY20579.1 putative ABC transport system ATP-binding protein [Pseudosporangium ferrugineum]